MDREAAARYFVISGVQTAPIEAHGPVQLKEERRQGRGRRKTRVGDTYSAGTTLIARESRAIKMRIKKEDHVDAQERPVRSATQWKYQTSLIVGMFDNPDGMFRDLYEGGSWTMRFFNPMKR